MLRDLNSDVILKNCLFWGVKLAKNADLGKYDSMIQWFDSGSEF